jgi:hypothetical protein
MEKEAVKRKKEMARMEWREAGEYLKQRKMFLTLKNIESF